MPAPAEIIQLVELFERNYDQYRSPAFSEAAVRHQFIDPFFAALGWDMSNAQQFAEPVKEVVHEDKVKVGGTTNAPDYGFYIGKERKFFVEAKKPSVDIQHDIEPAYQLRRYAWSAKLPLSILTDFEELSVYNCRSRPDHTDKASTGRILLLSYKEYVPRWDEIADVFGKTAVWQGALGKYAEAKAGKRGTAEVDDEFLAEIERWRELLASNLVLRNPTLRGRDVNWAVQQTIDRIVFLRICEARDLETFEQLHALLNGGHTYARLQELFRRADLRYNSGLFHFEVEKDRAEAPDTLTPSLDIDDKVLKEIIEHLYFPQSPYEFSVLPADILGHVYERFLGKVIRLTPGRQVKIEEKPEVRKAGGVFYTPTYIVDYIVQQTVGPLLEGKTPAQVGGTGGRGGGTAPLRILDAACGSGSFLLGAYQFLLDWHLAEYLKDPDRWLKGKRPPLERANGGIVRLSIEERKRILMNNLYGVDIDPQAVEVTKLSLLLKVLEGEGVAAQMSFLPERVLPDLGRNIKCGNSLIGPEFYDGKLDLPDEDAVGRVNAFDWAREFPEAMAPTSASAGGFDAVIGNPPWVSLTGKFGNDIYTTGEINYLQKKYQGNTYMPNVYEFFVAKGLDLVRADGRFSFIVPDRLGYNDQFVLLRARILEGHTVVSLLYKVPFPGVTVDTLIFVLKAARSPADHQIAIGEYGRPSSGVLQDQLKMDQKHRFQYDSDDELKMLFDRFIATTGVVALGTLMESTSGFGGKSALITTSRTSLGQIVVLKGSSIERYRSRHHYFFEFKKENITGRTTDTTKLSATPKILLRKTGDRIIATYDESKLFPEQSLYFLFGNRSPLHMKYVLGLLNSCLLTRYYQERALTNRASIAQVKKVDLDALPIRVIDFADPADVARHDRMVALITQMLDLRARLAAEGVPHEKAALQRRIEMIDRQIDALVYELYELTPEEIAVVEGTG